MRKPSLLSTAIDMVCVLRSNLAQLFINKGEWHNAKDALFCRLLQLVGIQHDVMSDSSIFAGSQPLSFTLDPAVKAVPLSPAD